MILKTAFNLKYISELPNNLHILYTLSDHGKQPEITGLKMMTKMWSFLNAILEKNSTEKERGGKEWKVTLKKVS